MSDTIIKEDLSFFQRSIRYAKELLFSLKNFSYEIGLNNNIPTVNDIDQTINFILKGMSIARFGDGEFRIINGFDIPFQKFDPKLKQKLKKIFTDKPNNLLIGLPETFSSLKKFTFWERIFWRKYMSKNRQFIYQLIDLKQNYGSAFFSRPYLRYKNKNNVQKIFNKIKEIWNSKDVLIIEGSGTRIGVGNDILNNSRSVKRIICPNINAFDKYNKILEMATKTKSDLILIALGPVAKALTYDLSKLNRQTIDVGHLDIEYEWFLKKTKKRIPIQNKNVLEANSYSVSECQDKQYLSQIIFNIK